MQWFLRIFFFALMYGCGAICSIGFTCAVIAFILALTAMFGVTLSIAWNIFLICVCAFFGTLLGFVGFVSLTKE